MKVRYAVTFEFDVRAPMTHRGIVTGGRAATCVARATREAQKALSPVGWSSMVCVLLERLDTAPEADDPEDDDAKARFHEFLADPATGAKLDAALEAVAKIDATPKPEGTE